MVAPKLGPERYVAPEKRIDVSATTLGSKGRIISAGNMGDAVELGAWEPGFHAMNSLFRVPGSRICRLPRSGQCWEATKY